MDPTGDEELILIPREADSREEYKAFDDPEKRAQHLKNQNLAGDIVFKRRYFALTQRVTGRWTCFIMCSVAFQMILNALGKGLSDASFIALITTTTTTLLGFWYLIGRYLFPHTNQEKDS